MEDLIHLQGPLTEDAVMRTLQARFNEHKYFVSNCFDFGFRHFPQHFQNMKLSIVLFLRFVHPSEGSRFFREQKKIARLE